jgi:hypothetical protein
MEVFVLLPEAHMAYEAILKRIKLLVPAKLDGTLQKGSAAVLRREI